MQNEPLDHPDAPLPPIPFGKVMLINIGIMLFYLTVTGMGKGHDYGPLMLDAMGVVGQTCVNLVVGVGLLFVPKQKHLGKAMLLAGLLIGVIGFGTCFGKYTLFG